MKSIVVFFDDNNVSRQNEAVFDGKSAVELSLAWAKSLSDSVVTIKAETVTGLLEKIKAACDEKGADYVIYSMHCCCCCCCCCC